MMRCKAGWTTIGQVSELVIAVGGLSTTHPDEGEEPIPPSAALRTAALSKSFGEVVAVVKVDFVNWPGEIFGLLAVWRFRTE